MKTKHVHLLHLLFIFNIVLFFGVDIDEVNDSMDIAKIDYELLNVVLGLVEAVVAGIKLNIRHKKKSRP